MSPQLKTKLSRRYKTGLYYKIFSKATEQKAFSSKRTVSFAVSMTVGLDLVLVVWGSKNTAMASICWQI